MDTFHAVVQKLAQDSVVWSRVQDELKAAQDRRRRFIELAQEYGMNIDAKELDQAVLAASGELKEDELESVSGGFNPQPEPPRLAISGQQQILVGLLLPAVQKVY
jgi:hypothetical protein